MNIDIKPDVVVIGTGRSGTSTAARILHTRLGVCMGHKFLKPNKYNSQGYWEDEYLRVEARLLAGGEMSTSEWLELFAKSHKDCRVRLKGYKKPILSEASPEVWQELNPQLIVRTWREFRTTVESLEKFAGKDTKWCEEYVTRRECGMDVGLVGLPVVTLRYDRQLSDDEVEAILRPHIDEIRAKSHNR